MPNIATREINNISVTATSPVGRVVPASDTSEVIARVTAAPPLQPSIRIIKRHDDSADSQLIDGGDDARFEILVMNT